MPPTHTRPCVHEPHGFSRLGTAPPMVGRNHRIHTMLPHGIHIASTSRVVTTLPPCPSPCGAVQTPSRVLSVSTFNVPPRACPQYGRSTPTLMVARARSTDVRNTRLSSRAAVWICSSHSPDLRQVLTHQAVIIVQSRPDSLCFFFCFLFFLFFWLIRQQTISYIRRDLITALIIFCALIA